MSGAEALVLAGAVPVAADAQQPAASAAPLAFDGVTVVDVEHGALLRGQRVVIAGNRIQAMGSANKIKLPKGTKVVHARGKYLMPGLWDMHTHSNRLTSVFYPLFIANGVTGIRDAASEVPLDTLLMWRREILAGTRIGPPRQILSGQSIDEDPSCTRAQRLHTCVANAADARHLVDSFKTAGVDMLKTYDLSSAMYFTIAAEARRAGLPFGGHTSVPATEASDSGARIIDHTTLNEELTTHCLYGEASVELCRPLAERFVRNGTWWVPTWIFPPQIAGRARARSIAARFSEFVRDFLADAVNGNLHDYLRRAATDSNFPSPRSYGDRLSRPHGGSTPDSAGYMYVVQRAGLPVLAGTDSYGPKWLGGFFLHAELATYAVEDMTPLEALRTATLNPAKFLHATDSLGTVAPGKLADLVLLDANPLADIINTTTIRAVVANGRYFDRAALDGLLAEAWANAAAQP